MLEKGKKFDSFEHKITQYHKSRFEMISKNHEKNSVNGYTQEYISLGKAKRDIEKIIHRGLNGGIIFSQIIESGFLPMRKELINFEDERKMLVILSDYDFRGSSLELKNRYIHDQINFISDIFSEDRLEKIFDSIFAFNIIKITKKHKKKREYDNDGNEIENWEYSEEGFKPNDFESNYMKNVATLMVKRGIEELKKYLNDKSRKLLQQDLDKSVEIAELIASNSDSKIIEKRHSIINKKSNHF